MPTHTSRVLEPAVSLTPSERAGLADLLSGLLPDPYRHYPGFHAEVEWRSSSSVVPDVLRDFARARATHPDPIGLLAGAPIDDALPDLDYDEPVMSKYLLKQSFVAEGFLCLFGILAGTPAIAHVNINHGDVFQDVRPKRSAAHSQTQKAIGALVWHRDLSNHYAQPDHLYLLGLVRPPQARVWTAVARDAEVTDALPPDVLEVARKDRFVTPYRDIEVGGDVIDFPRPPSHPIVSPTGSLELMEGLTRGIDDAAQQVLEKVLQTVRENQCLVDIGPGDFLAIQNKRCLHARVTPDELREEAFRSRWIMKTTNVDDLTALRAFTFEGAPHLVRG